MILYIENPKETIRKLLKLIKEFSKVMTYKVISQKSLAFLYNSKEKSESEIKESIPFTIAMKIIKYLGINLPKDRILFFKMEICLIVLFAFKPRNTWSL